MLTHRLIPPLRSRVTALRGDAIRTGTVMATRSDGSGGRKSIRLEGRFVDVATGELGRAGLLLVRLIMPNPPFPSIS